MARAVGKTQCPNCAKIGRDRHHDNLILYDDGGKHCFSCQYHVNADGFKRAANEPNVITEPSGTYYPLPTDVEPLLPSHALEWLAQYKITLTDIVQNNIMWSENREMIIFPYAGAWQGRYLGNEKKPKWFSQGKLDEIIHGMNLTDVAKTQKGVILVEDIISAIRIGNCGFPVVCLFGSNLSNSRISRLAWITDRMTLWLDYDKRKSAILQAMRLKSLDIYSGVIVTEYDPKCYEDEDIKRIIKENK